MVLSFLDLDFQRKCGCEQCRGVTKIGKKQKWACGSDCVCVEQLDRVRVGALGLFVCLCRQWPKRQTA